MKEQGGGGKGGELMGKWDDFMERWKFLKWWKRFYSWIYILECVLDCYKVKFLCFHAYLIATLLFAEAFHPSCFIFEIKRSESIPLSVHARFRYFNQHGNGEPCEA